ncbi:MAG: P-II family nitrogen regulator [Clostridia bacterium]|nr:P-II family nitrogen regulator [Clostridia bacterium]
MSELHLMVTITNRARFPEFIELYRSHGLEVNLIALGYGTARSDVLGVLGLDKSEKAVCFSFVTAETWRKVKRDLEGKIYIDVPDTGIAFIVPMSSIGGRRELAYLTDGQEFTKGDETVLKDTVNELLVVISNQGYNDVVMDAAREAGAAGGTVIHAKGTGSHRAERFLGISLASEKDVVFIVTKTSRKNAIMRSIMDKAGMETDAKSIVFSLPVTDTAGLRLLEAEEA